MLIKKVTESMTLNRIEQRKENMWLALTNLLRVLSRPQKIWD